MQPLAYQIGKATCWITSITNGIMFLRKGLRIESYQYKILHAALNSVLDREGVELNEYRDSRDYKLILNILETTFSVDFREVAGADVAAAVQELHFKKQVAICDVGNGDHAILLIGRRNSGGWLSAFDPWWYKERTDNDNVQFPNNQCVENVRILQDHLLNDAVGPHRHAYKKGLAYPIGQNIANRFLIVMEKRD